jgi:peroxiredoxin
MYRDRGLALIGVSVQETTPSDVAAYADRYRLGYTIGFDGSGDVLREYKVYALPTQFFIDTNGVIRQVVNGPVDQDGAKALIESMLPKGTVR